MQYVSGLERRFDTLVGRQQRRPVGIVGRLVAEQMVRQHVPETFGRFPS